MPVPGRGVRASAKLDDVFLQRDWRIGDRMLGRIAESVRSLNSLAQTSVDDVKRAAFPFSGHQPTGKPTMPQRAVLQRVARLIRDGGPCPVGQTPKSCFEEICKSRDMYALNRSNAAPYDPEQLKIMKSNTVPKPAHLLLPEHEARCLLEPSRHIVRSDDEIRGWMEENKTFEPYWDETLRKDVAARHQLYHRLAEKKLLSFRRRIKSKVGLFFVWKSGRKGVRLIVDCRMPNGCHRRPPKTKLGGASALAELDTFIDEHIVDDNSEGFGGPVSLPQYLFGATGDVSDAFYQFSVEHLAEWFGLDDPVRAGDFNVESIWDPDLGRMVDVDEDEKIFPVFVGMPQGWTWALHMCQAAVEYGMRSQVPAKRMVKEGVAARDLNIGVFGLVESVVGSTFDGAVAKLEDAGFVLHELEKGGVDITNVGIVIHRDSMKLKHSRKRSWRLYLALKHVLRLKRMPTEALRVVLGHIVHYFSIMRPGLIAVCTMPTGSCTEGLMGKGTTSPTT